MEIAVRPVTPEEYAVVGEMFAAHIAEQFSMDPYPMPNSAFDARLFIEAMMNPKVNEILVPTVDGKIAGFARLAILYGEGMLPLAGPPKRTESSYVKRLPVIVLRKLRGILDRYIAKLEDRRTVSFMAAPLRRGYIADFYISPEYRRKGVGSSLHDACVEWFKSQQTMLVDLMFLENNAPGKSFWKSKEYLNYRVAARKKIV